MSNLERKIRREKEKKRKKRARKGLKDAIRATAGIPTQCTQCATEFDLNKDADSWFVDMTDGVTQLLCPACLTSFLKT